MQTGPEGGVLVEDIAFRVLHFSGYVVLINSGLKWIMDTVKK